MTAQIDFLSAEASLPHAADIVWHFTGLVARKDPGSCQSIPLPIGDRKSGMVMWNTYANFLELSKLRSLSTQCSTCMGGLGAN